MDGSTETRHPRAATDGAVHGRARRRVVLAALCLGVLVAQVDTSVVNLAMQPIGKTFHIRIEMLQWVLDAYNLVYAVLLLTGGLLADRYGRRRCFAAGAAILALTSLACAMAPGPATLIAGRAAAGAGAALLLPASLAIIRVGWPDAVARRRVLGVWASCNGLAFVIGPGLGGVLIARFGWRSVFLLAVPLAAAALLLAAPIPASRDQSRRPLDGAGQMLGALGLGALVFAAIADGGVSTHALALVVALGALAGFLVREAGQGEQALVPLRLFAAPGFAGAMAATGAMTFGIYGLIFLLPLAWLQSGFLSAREAGLALMPCALAFFLISQASAELSRLVGLRTLPAGGVAVIALALWIIAATAAGRPLPLAELGLVLGGIGMGLCTGPLMAVCVESAPPERSGTASSLFNLARMVGATLGVAILGTIDGLGGAAGLRLAMLAGGAVQLLGAAAAWRARR